MTTIAYRDGILAADSQMTYVGDEDSGSRKHKTQKLFRRQARGSEVIIATAGEGPPGMIFVDWYCKKKAAIPAVLHDADFTCLVLDEDGLWEFDKWCRAERIEEEFYAIGSGAKAALGAMHAGSSAYEAVCIAARVDPFTGGEVVTMELTGVR